MFVSVCAFVFFVCVFTHMRESDSGKERAHKWKRAGERKRE